MVIMCIPNRRQKVRRPGLRWLIHCEKMWKIAFRWLLQLSQWSDVAACIRCGKNLLFTESILAKLVSSLSFCMAWYHNAYMNANFDKFWRDLRFWSSSTTFLLDFLGSSLVILEAKILKNHKCKCLFWKLWFENNLSKPMHQKESTTRLWEASNSCQSKHNQAV